jgi:sec-independent protein translocase protein TatA
VFSEERLAREKMAFDPLELGTIAAVIIIFFLWGPQKIPELARMLAQARREFDNASREFQKVSASIQDGTNPLLAPPASAPAAPPLPQPAQQDPNPALPQPPSGYAAVKTGDQLLIEAARRLGIATQGKTREQIQQDIIERAQSRPPVGGTPSTSSKGDPPA